MKNHWNQFQTEGTEEAFSALVKAHLGLVYSTALRRVNGDRELAKDAAQLVFVHLLRKGASIRDEAALGGWLYRHTCFTCGKLIRSDSR